MSMQLWLSESPVREDDAFEVPATPRRLSAFEIPATPRRLSCTVQRKLNHAMYSLIMFHALTDDQSTFQIIERFTILKYTNECATLGFQSLQFEKTMRMRYQQHLEDCRRLRYQRHLEDCRVQYNVS